MQVRRLGHLAAGLAHKRACPFGVVNRQGLVDELQLPGARATGGKFIDERDTLE
ncbi:hypothetical protein D3C76_1742210 [compost metagenome]